MTHPPRPRGPTNQIRHTGPAPAQVSASVQNSEESPKKRSHVSKDKNRDKKKKHKTKDLIDHLFTPDKVKVEQVKKIKSNDSSNTKPAEVKSKSQNIKSNGSSKPAEESQSRRESKESPKDKKKSPKEKKRSKKRSMGTT